MSKFVTLHGFSSGGGSELNFEVVGGTTEPSNPSENTIWINTDTEIAGYYFSATQPENMSDGEVWVLTSAQSAVSFDVLKENNITVYPVQAKQMKSGTLTSVNAKMYKDGAWVTWTYIMNLERANWSNMATYQNACSVSYSNGALTCSSSQNTNVYSTTGIYHEIPVDLTNYKTAKITATFNYSGYGNARCGFSNNLSISNLTSAPAYITWSSSSTTGTKTIDISNLSGNYYFMLQYYLGGNGNGSTKITSIELE